MITLNIEDTSIKVMVIDRGRIKVAVISNLDPGLVVDGLVVDKSAVSQQIKDIWATYRISERKVVASVSGLHSIYRWVKIPKLPKPLIAEAAKRELLRVLPVSIDEIYLSWQSVSTPDAENILTFIGLPRNTVDALLDTLHEAGLECKVMDVKPLAMARIADDSDAIVVDVQPVCFDIAVMIDGIPDLIRSISFPDRNITEDEKINIVRDEIERTIGFYNSSHKERPITSDISTYVSGDYKEALIGLLDYNIKPVPKMVSSPEGFVAGDYIVNIGLALKLIRVAASKLRININTIPELYKPKPFPVIAVASWIFIVIAVFILVVTIINTGNALQETAALQNKVNIAQTQVEAVKGDAEELKELQETLQITETTLTNVNKPLESYAKQRKSVITGLSDVTSMLPGYIVLNSITYQKPKEVEELLIAGYAPDKTTILSYLTDLKNTDRYDQVKVLTMDVVEYNKVSFTLTLLPIE
jgi:type IV pilus assembly protein PilM